MLNRSCAAAVFVGDLLSLQNTVLETENPLYKKNNLNVTKDAFL